MQPPDVRYARNGDVSLAYQVVGEGPVDLAFIPQWSNLAYVWESPLWAGFFERLASFSRLILLDKRGTGLSDRTHSLPTLEIRMDDLRAVLDAVGSERTVLLGALEGGQMCALFAATHPERTHALVLFNTVATMVDRGVPWGATRERADEFLAAVREGWGTRPFLERLLEEFEPSLARDPAFRRFFVTYYRLIASPGAAYAFYRMMLDTDVGDVLGAIRVPTLVLYRRNFRDPVFAAAARIPGARIVEVPGLDFSICVGDEVADEVERFLGGTPTRPVPDRVLTTLLFTDIVRSTEHAAELGDLRWRRLLAEHHAIVRRHLDRYRGREVATLGDGFFATFDGPARAINCAVALHAPIGELGLELRAGVHTGECELMDGNLGGIAVHIGARVAAQAQPGEVLVSSTVKDLVAGSGIGFRDRGEHELKGVPASWRLYAVDR